VSEEKGSETKTKTKAKVFAEKTDAFKKALQKVQKWSKEYKNA